MKRTRDIVGLPVVALDTGRTIGRVEEVVYSIQDRSLKGLVLGKSGWLKEQEVILYSDVISIGRDAVTVASEYSKQPLHSITSLQPVLSEAKFNKQRLLTRSGELLGIVQDVIIEENEGVITAIEVSEGLLSDIKDGRTQIPLPQQVTLDKTNCIISEGEQGV